MSLPPRQYDLAGAVLAEAIDTAAETGEAVTDAVARVAEARGRALVAGGAEARGGADAALTDAAALLAQHGYEPRRTDRGIELANCPFHELSRTHTRLVCGMNEALLTGVAEELAPGCLRARLDPAPGRCLRRHRARRIRRLSRPAAVGRRPGAGDDQASRAGARRASSHATRSSSTFARLISLRISWRAPG